MICFHFTIFVVLETTGKKVNPPPFGLWFAFILLSLSYWKQQSEWLQCAGVSCDLLSFYYLCRTGNNNPSIYADMPKVVICFHFTIFVVLETTHSPIRLTRFSLWFAFILLSLSYWKQRLRHSRRGALSCDLLSFYYLCRTGNNYWGNVLSPWWVVICFHFTIFVVLETTISRSK